MPTASLEAATKSGSVHEIPHNGILPAAHGPSHVQERTRSKTHLHKTADCRPGLLNGCGAKTWNVVKDEQEPKVPSSLCHVEAFAAARLGVKVRRRRLENLRTAMWNHQRIYKDQTRQRKTSDVRGVLGHEGSRVALSRLSSLPAGEDMRVLSMTWDCHAHEASPSRS